MIRSKERSTPSTPASGYSALDPKTGGKWYFLTSAGVETIMQGTVFGTAQATTSGTAKDFTGIPTGVTRLTMFLAGVSTNGTANPRVQLGDSGGLKTTGYLVGGTYAGGANQTGGTNPTSGFDFNLANASNVINGEITFRLMDPATNLWIGTGAWGTSSVAFVTFVSGSIALSGALDRVRLTTSNGTDAFDAGAVNISYE
jgi:hypothetical protein